MELKLVEVIMEAKDRWLTLNELSAIMERANKIYELPGFEVTHKDTAAWAGKVAAICCEEQDKKTLKQVVSMFDAAMPYATKGAKMPTYLQVIEQLRQEAEGK